MLGFSVAAGGLSGASPACAQGPNELWVFAAASLAPAFESLKPQFEAQHPGQKVVMQFAASGTLMAQLRQGAPADVLATADSASMSRAAQAALIVPGSRGVFAGNRLVLVAPRRPIAQWRLCCSA